MYKINIRQQIRPELLLYCLAIGTIVIWASWTNRTQLFQPTDMIEIGRKFSQSQYILGNEAVEWIDDSLTYAFAGVAYIQGESPTVTNFEHPPLVKYVFGLSYLISSSVYFFNTFILIFILVVFVMLAKRLGITQIFTVFSMILFTISTPLISHVGQTMLDSWIVLFTLLFLFLLLSKNIGSFKVMSSVGVILGVVASSRYPFPFILLYISVLGLWLIHKKRLSRIIIIVPYMIATYMFTYSAFFLHGNTLIDFIRFEIYRFNWRLGSAPFAIPYSIYTLFYGCVQNWWSDTNPNLCTPDADWRWWLPMLATAQFPAQVYQLVKRNMEVVIVGIFASAMLVMLLMASFSQMRYIYPLIPLWILLCALTVQQIINRYLSSSKTIKSTSLTEELSEKSQTD